MIEINGCYLLEQVKTLGSKTLVTTLYILEGQTSQVVLLTPLSSVREQVIQGTAQAEIVKSKTITQII